MEGTYVHLCLIYADEWQKLTQYCKAIILQLNFFFFKRKTSANIHVALAPRAKFYTFTCAILAKILLLHRQRSGKQQAVPPLECSRE